MANSQWLMAFVTISNEQLSRSVEINITGFSDWGLGIGDWELGIGKPYPVTSHQSPVPSTLSRQLIFNYA